MSTLPTPKSGDVLVIGGLRLPFKKNGRGPTFMFGDTGPEDTLLEFNAEDLAKVLAAGATLEPKKEPRRFVFEGPFLSGLLNPANPPSRFDVVDKDAGFEELNGAWFRVTLEEIPSPPSSTYSVEEDPRP
jgi:hypothetical protein